MPAPPEPPLPSRPRSVLLAPIDRFGIGTYDAIQFVGRLFSEGVRPPYHAWEVVRQGYEIGVKSLPLICLTGFVTGIVFTKQSRPSLAAFGATSWLPSLITIALVGALAPLITALICAGKVGSGIGAELASMKVTEQVDALEVSGINPFKYLVVTRVLATTLMVPALTVVCCLVGLIGSYLNVHGNEATSLQSFLKDGFENVLFLDIFASIAKSFCFGFTIAVIACFQGLAATSGTQGVGRAANLSVVSAMFAIFMEEILIVQVVTWLRAS